MKKKLFRLALVLAILFAASMLYLNKKMEEQKDPYNVSTVLDDKGVKLYKRGFRLLEEQLATYIKEHYSGVSKIEFSPIFVQGGDGQTLFSANIVFSIYDKNQNKAYVGETIGNITYPTYDNVWDVRMDFNGLDEEIIELRTSDKKLIDVSDFQHLPPEAKLKVSDKVDENLEALVNAGHLNDVVKSEKGSQKAEILYNTEIMKGGHLEWP
ncbi:hypothetical protein [Streptococcus australis]|jgi:hypothetical protein|uniref:hypothetical protein n=1 Tax=Streptococcus australis TaxID=113107 RepID=UPI001CBCF3B6|nr:hypothetical protein [Streptococcus australis]